MSEYLNITAREHEIKQRHLLDLLPANDPVKTLYDDLTRKVMLRDGEDPKLAGQLWDAVFEAQGGSKESGRKAQDLLKSAKADAFELQKLIGSRKDVLRPEITKRLQEVKGSLDAVTGVIETGINSISGGAKFAHVDLSSVVGSGKPIDAGKLGVSNVGVATQVTFDNRTYNFAGKTQDQAREELSKLREHIQEWHANRSNLANDAIGNLSRDVNQALEAMEKAQTEVAQKTGIAARGKMLSDLGSGATRKTESDIVRNGETLEAKGAKGGFMGMGRTGNVIAGAGVGAAAGFAAAKVMGSESEGSWTVGGGIIGGIVGAMRNVKNVAVGAIHSPAASNLLEHAGDVVARVR